MYVFNSINSKWLPVISAVNLLYLIILFFSEAVTLYHVIASPLIIVPVMMWAVKLASIESDFTISAFFRRKANAVTLLRAVLASAGILTALFSAFLKLNFLL